MYLLDYWLENYSWTTVFYTLQAPHLQEQLTILIFFSILRLINKTH